MTQPTRNQAKAGIRTIVATAGEKKDAVISDLKSLIVGTPEPAAKQKPLFDDAPAEGMFIKLGLKDGSTHIVLLLPDGKMQEAPVSNLAGAWEGTHEVTKDGKLEMTTGEWTTLFSPKRNALKGYDGAAAQNGKPMEGQYMLLRLAQ